MSESRTSPGAPRLVAIAASLFVLAGTGTPQPDRAPDSAPPLYTELREVRLEPAGRIRAGTIGIDRFELELADTELHLLAPVGGQVTGAVLLGNGVIRGYPPDAVEHHQLRKFLDRHHLEERFDKAVLRFSGDLGARLRALAEPAARLDTSQATTLYKRRHEELLKHRLGNPDSRILADLLAVEARLTAPTDARSYLWAQFDGERRGWFDLEIEPGDLEEVALLRYDRPRNVSDVWMASHATTDFSPEHLGDPLAGFAVEPESLGKRREEIRGQDLGLPARPRLPDREGWSPRAAVIQTDVDLAIDGNGEVSGTATMLIEALQPLAAIRLRISPTLRVTDVRWQPPRLDVDLGGREAADQRSAIESGRPATATDARDARRAGEPRPPRGDSVQFVQARRPRFMEDDLFEPWVTIVPPRPVEAGEQVTLGLAYEGKLLEQLRASGDFVLLDTFYWVPRHPDMRRSRFDLTFRMPERYRVASGGELVAEHAEDGTRLMRWVLPEPVRSVSFHLGRFEVTEIPGGDGPPLAIYANRHHPGFAPGNREKTTEDLTGSVRIYREYFGPFPFASLLITETAVTSGQAFPGLILLSFQTFGELHTGESELFRSHEVAHQWWGAAIDWEHYRDQWLSEGFAHYAAALYTLAGLGRERQFRDILSAWRHDVLRQINVGQGIGLKHYGFRPEVIQKSKGSDSGPLVAGYRLRAAETPFDYRLLVYEKGAFVLHMLRMMLTELETGDDRRFRALMRDFAGEHLHAVTNTRAFEAAVSRTFGESMAWFFDQWVYGVAVPTYRSDLKAVHGTTPEAPYLLRGTISQDDVPEGFRMPVPIYLTFQEHPPQALRVWVDAPRVDVELPLPAAPTSMEFNYLDSVLARVR